MLKVILFAVIGLLVGIGGGSAASVMQAKKAHAVYAAQRAQVVADSLAKADEDGKSHVASAPTPGDSAAHDAAPSDSSHAPVPVTRSADATPPARQQAAHGDRTEGTAAQRATAPATKPASSYNRAVQTVESHGTPGEKPLAAVRPPLPLKPMTAPAASPGTAKVAKIFAAMPAKDAAKVLEQLDDAEVQDIIASLSEKQAAAILQVFPPPRAAAISKAVLRSVPMVKP